MSSGYEPAYYALNNADPYYVRQPERQQTRMPTLPMRADTAMSMPAEPGSPLYLAVPGRGSWLGNSFAEEAHSSATPSCTNSVYSTYNMYEPAAAYYYPEPHPPIADQCISPVEMYPPSANSAEEPSPVDRAGEYYRGMSRAVEAVADNFMGSLVVKDHGDARGPLERPSGRRQEDESQCGCCVIA
ncbi:hypothetical protein FOMPIDRAFT_1046229 [Fomitopsis schrenkii]|uniref:Uncharacterized protein n=1 Tax=Fomitopsis schrenkii TaxID=2126942 RepID=S8G208_FOMSC|nr:hypothetical protein FOMPIDRAFT_1046229 [Fomitopsis schrenkii]